MLECIFKEYKVYFQILLYPLSVVFHSCFMIFIAIRNYPLKSKSFKFELS